MQVKLNCQYCGENERLEINQYNGEYAVHCQHCGSIGPMAKDEEFAILKWNDRIQEAPEMPQERPTILSPRESAKRICPLSSDGHHQKDCAGDACMMWLWVGDGKGRCGLVNTIYGTTGCGL